MISDLKKHSVAIKKDMEEKIYQLFSHADEKRPKSVSVKMQCDNANKKTILIKIKD